jgi:hypothetical protein
MARSKRNSRKRHIKGGAGRIFDISTITPIVVNEQVEDIAYDQQDGKVYLLTKDNEIFRINDDRSVDEYKGRSIRHLFNNKKFLEEKAIHRNGAMTHMYLYLDRVKEPFIVTYSIAVKAPGDTHISYYSVSYVNSKGHKLYRICLSDKYIFIVHEPVRTDSGYKTTIVRIDRTVATRNHASNIEIRFASLDSYNTYMNSTKSYINSSTPTILSLLDITPSRPSLSAYRPFATPTKTSYKY